MRAFKIKMCSVGLAIDIYLKKDRTNSLFIANVPG